MSLDLDLGHIRSRRLNGHLTALGKESEREIAASSADIAFATRIIPINGAFTAEIMAIAM
jgi:hypothetical protein